MGAGRGLQCGDTESAEQEEPQISQMTQILISENEGFILLICEICVIGGSKFRDFCAFCGHSFFLLDPIPSVVRSCR